MNNFKITNNRVYKRALKRELFIWSKSASGQQNSINDQKNLEKIGEYNPILTSYNNSLLGIYSADPFGWIKYLQKSIIPDYNLNPCLSLGSGSGIIEKKLVKELKISHIDTIDIIDSSSKEGFNNDLNFVKLESDKYNCIFACSILHHIINIEHLLHQVNNALMPNGLFIAYDYIGENKQQWDSNKIKLINDHLKINFGKKYKNIRIIVPPIKNISPFESIRSGEITKSIDYYFDDGKLFEKKWGSCSYPILNSLSFINRKGIEKFEKDTISKILEVATKIDKENITNETIKQCHIFGIYKKTKAIIEPIAVHKWSRKIVKEELNLKLSVKRRMRFYLNYYSYKWPLLLKIIKRLK